MKFCLSYFLIFFCTSFFIVLAVPEIAPHLSKVFVSTGKHPYQKRIPWAIKHTPQINWMNEFEYSQKYLNFFFLKGFRSTEELFKVREELKRRNRQNSNQIKKMIDQGNLGVPQWALRKYRRP